MPTKPRRHAKAPLLLATMLLCGAAHAQDASWILEPQLTPARLASDGASLTASELVRWPDGPSVDLTYWLGAGDIVYRCATLSAEGASNASCWRRQLVARAGGDSSRHFSTRQRPAPIIVDPAQSVGYTPYLWVEASRGRLPPGPRPTPLPTPPPPR
jgi:hypothetical protein